MLTTGEVESLLDSARVSYPRTPRSKEAIAIWQDLLGNVELHHAKRAMRAYLMGEHERGPTPAAIRRMAREHATDDSATEAERPPCAPCRREGGVRMFPDTDVLSPPQPSRVGPQDKHGPSEPLCFWHLEREALASHREAAERGTLKIDGEPRECHGHWPDPPRAVVRTEKGWIGYDTPAGKRFVESLRGAK